MRLGDLKSITRTARRKTEGAENGRGIATVLREGPLCRDERDFLDSLRSLGMTC